MVVPLLSIAFLKMLKVKVGNENMLFMTLNLLSHNDYCRACHMRLTSSHTFIREIWGKSAAFIF